MRRLFVKLYKMESETAKENILKELSEDDFYKLAKFAIHYRETLEKSYNHLRHEHLRLQKLKDNAKNPFTKVWWILSEAAKKKWEEACRKSDYYIEAYEKIVKDEELWELVLSEIDSLIAATPEYNSESNYHRTCYFVISRFLDNMNNNVFPIILKESLKRADELEKNESKQ